MPENRFNEAAAYHCGKLEARERCGPRWCGFNEAAAYHCGKPALLPTGARYV